MSTGAAAVRVSEKMEELASAEGGRGEENEESLAVDHITRSSNRRTTRRTALLLYLEQAAHGDGVVVSGARESFDEPDRASGQ